MVNVLYLTDTGDIKGGGEISLLGLLENMDRLAFKPLVVVPGEGTFTQALHKADIPFAMLPFKKMLNPINMATSIKAVQELAGIISRFDIDLVHSNSTGGAVLLAGLASRIAERPFVSHVRLIDTGLLSDIAQRIFSTRIIVISDAVGRRFYRSSAKGKVVRIYNGVDLEKFNPGIDRQAFREEIGCGRDSHLIGMVGNYHPSKSLENFVNASAVIAQKLSDSVFVIIGSNFSEANSYVKRLTKMSERLGLKKRLIFKGERDDVPKVMASLDIFMYPAVDEPFGRVMMEAAACARPIVAFNSGGAPEIVVESKTGFLVPPGDCRGMAIKAVALLKDKKLLSEMGSAARKRAEEVFDIRDHARKIEKLYMDVIEGYGKR